MRLVESDACVLRIVRAFASKLRRLVLAIALWRLASSIGVAVGARILRCIVRRSLGGWRQDIGCVRCGYRETVHT